MRRSYLEMLILTFGFVSVSAALSQPVSAYIDPGTGSYFVQIIVASAASFMFFFIKPTVQKIKGLFKKTRPKPTEHSNDNIQK